ncbi:MULTISPECIES: autorepressor SdpR family transcription factor [Bacillaceae]|uniref:autorepressor SdpR family transcription factor n=1 Tax=Bacillaceae TaxID=186817 RepID=UPI001EDABD9D|nr:MULTISPECIES: autorepressor SdpR family transcription factor [Bacillaceae]UPO91023.1 autorepressor SdpR family transcription factor [Niallia sp. Man26]
MIDAYKALSDTTRRKILELLKERDMTVNEITGYFNISQPSISHHLSILKNSGLIESSKEGKYVKYSLNLTVLHEIMGWFMKLMNKVEEEKYK